VIGLGSGTGSAFALLPPQNATGNWIKIVQRLPVRIRLDPQELAAHPLRAGLSMNVSIDTHDRSGPVLANAPSLEAGPRDESVRARPRRRRAARTRDRAGQPRAGQRRDRRRGAVGMPPLSARQRAGLTVALSLAVFMNVLDLAIANVAIPDLAGELGTSADQGTWVITSFAVSAAIAMPLTGWLGRRFGEVRVFLVCTAMFTIASLACGLSSSLAMLIAMRTIQGVFGGPMIPLSQSLLLNNYPEDRKSLAMALLMMVTIVAPVLGPILGGWITDNWNWAWIFYINLPVGIAATLVTAALLRGRETPTARVPVDFVGIGLLALGIGSLQIMLDRGKDLDWFRLGQHRGARCRRARRALLLRRLGADRGAPGGGPHALRAAQLHGGHGCAVPRLLRLFRQHRAAAAVAADADGLHRDLGRACLGAGRAAAHRAGRARRTVLERRRPALDHHGQHVRFRIGVVLVRRLQHRGELSDARLVALRAGRGPRALLRAADVDPPLGAAARAPGERRWAGEHPAHARRQLRHPR